MHLSDVDFLILNDDAFQPLLVLAVEDHVASLLVDIGVIVRAQHYYYSCLCIASGKKKYIAQMSRVSFGLLVKS